MSRVLVILTTCVFFANAQAHEFHLFEPGKPGVFSPTYVKQLGEIREALRIGRSSVVLIFSNGVRKTVHSYLGEGSVSVVLELSNSLAIRIPKHASVESRKQIDDYYSAWQILHSSACQRNFLFQIVERLPGEYLVVDRLNIEMTYEGFKKKFKPCYVDEDSDVEDYDKNDLTEECNYCKITEINENLIQFAFFLSEFRGIQDISPTNIAYVKNTDGTHRWVLLDFALPVTKRTPGELAPTNGYNLLTPIEIPKDGSFAIAKSVAKALRLQIASTVCSLSETLRQIQLTDDLLKIERKLCEKFKEIHLTPP